MNEIRDIASATASPVEDAAEAMGAVYNGRYCGTLVNGIFFNGNKMITTSGGGAFIMPSRKEAQSEFSMLPGTWTVPLGTSTNRSGYNYRLSNVSAGIGRGQMRVVDNHIGRPPCHPSAIHRAAGRTSGITVVEPQESAPYSTQLLADYK